VNRVLGEARQFGANMLSARFRLLQVPAMRGRVRSQARRFDAAADGVEHTGDVTGGRLRILATVFVKRCGCELRHSGMIGTHNQSLSKSV